METLNSQSDTKLRCLFSFGQSINSDLYMNFSQSVWFRFNTTMFQTVSMREVIYSDVYTMTFHTVGMMESQIFILSLYFVPFGKAIQMGILWDFTPLVWHMSDIETFQINDRNSWQKFRFAYCENSFDDRWKYLCSNQGHRYLACLWLLNADSFTKNPFQNWSRQRT